MTDVDLHSPAFMANPFPGYAALRRESPVHHVAGPMGLGMWLITRHDDARAVLTDPRFSKNVRLAPDWLKVMGGGQGDEGLLGANMLNMDPPDHTRVRGLVVKAFSRRRMEALRPRVQQITDSLLDEVAQADSFDLIPTLAVPLPIIVICELLGIPVSDRTDFRRWTQMVLTPPLSPEAIAIRKDGNRAMEDYLTALLAERRARVNAGVDADAQPDMLDALLVASAEEGVLAVRELIGTVKLLLVAGQNAGNLVGNGMLALLTHPDQLEALRDDPALLPGAIEELLRYDGPIERALPRFTTEDVEVGGVRIPAGSAVAVVLSSASHDTGAEHPERLDITREESAHLAFGGGIHYCLGAPLARIEGQIAIGTVLRRFPAIKIAADAAELKWTGRGLNFIRGLVSLPVAV
ncbi:cytochrome P450 [Actinokineospora guangxiensis]|uniref:Cytochrome P450 n=1 Tax=Actinokineospora guangxiensis TaxID=1490288 RepID=A0ABW0EST0_9PSEU